MRPSIPATEWHEPALESEWAKRTRSVVGPDGQVVEMGSVRQHVLWKRFSSLLEKFQRSDWYDVNDALVRKRIFQGTSVDMTRQGGGHEGPKVNLGVRWDFAGDKRSKLPRVAAVIKGGNADKAGLEAEDRLVGVSGGGKKLSLRKWAAAADRPPLEAVTTRLGFPMVLHVRRGFSRALLDVTLSKPTDDVFGAYSPSFGLTEMSPTGVPDMVLVRGRDPSLHAKVTLPPCTLHPEP